MTVVDFRSVPKILCEDHGSFLEIADSIRGFGLTILKGVMEARNRRVWARFLVEVGRPTTRFLTLIVDFGPIGKNLGRTGLTLLQSTVIDAGESEYQQDGDISASGSAPGEDARQWLP